MKFQPLHSYQFQKMEDFVSYLGHPEKKFPTVHIAGTNGKGSTAHMVAAALQTAGHTTGVATCAASPGQLG